MELVTVRLPTDGHERMVCGDFRLLPAMPFRLLSQHCADVHGDFVVVAGQVVGGQAVRDDFPARQEIVQVGRLRPAGTLVDTAPPAALVEFDILGEQHVSLALVTSAGFGVLQRPDHLRDKRTQNGRSGGSRRNKIQNRGTHEASNASGNADRIV